MASNGSAGDVVSGVLIREKSIKISFPKDGAESDIFAFLESVNVKVEDLLAVQALPGKEFDVTFKSTLLRRTKWPAVAASNSATAESYFEDLKVVNVLHVPHELNDNVVRYVLGKYGKVVCGRFLTYKGKPGLFNGTRQYKMALTKDIPSSIKLAGRDCWVRYFGQPITCLKCGEQGHLASACQKIRCFKCLEIGHVSSNCSKQVVCTVCGKEGHTYQGCPISFANRVGGPSTTWTKGGAVVVKTKESGDGGEKAVSGAEQEEVRAGTVEEKETTVEERSEQDGVGLVGGLEGGKRSEAGVDARAESSVGVSSGLSVGAEGGEGRMETGGGPGKGAQGGVPGGDGESQGLEGGGEGQGSGVGSGSGERGGGKGGGCDDVLVVPETPMDWAKEVEESRKQEGKAGSSQELVSLFGGVEPASGPSNSPQVDMELDSQGFIAVGDSWKGNQRGRGVKRGASSQPRSQSEGRPVKREKEGVDRARSLVGQCNILTGEQDWISCPEEGCTEVFDSYDLYCRHVVGTHNYTSLGRVPCPIQSCSVTCNTPTEWCQHLANKHPRFVQQHDVEFFNLYFIDESKCRI
ncbi:Zinc finger CCHC domain-containing protein 3 [Holothuria leucospilota]|uniref:Zinc finger CCHC domain-containing protein 3 n=1 Tax=Holothuria leucospilota TaxID=206669 RepID=A0A9Q1HKV4_HOLLE|nr:Zinc finger CCHC domain-containing protein 3 [Holothuria leucospilota]